MVNVAEHRAVQDRYEERYFERMDAERPKPAKELEGLRALAERAVEGDGSAALDFAVSCTPEQFLLALKAKRWDECHPFYNCIHCHDGKDLPSGYLCQVCGEEGPR